jgi:hypothetical protein
LCVQGYHFDETAEVCGCVEDVNPCAAVSCLTGSECVVTDGEAQCVPVHGHPHPFPAPHHPHWPRMPHWHWGHR